MKNTQKIADNFQRKFEKGDYLSFFLDEFMQYLKEQQEDGKDVKAILMEWRLDTDEYLPFDSYSFRKLCWIFINAFAWCLKNEDLSDIGNYEDMEMYIKIIQGDWHWQDDMDNINEEEK